MVGPKILLFIYFVALCESKRSLVPQAILQIVKSHYSALSKIQLFYNSERIKILDETLKLLGNVQGVTIINIESEKFEEFEDQGSLIVNYEKNVIFLFDTVENYLEYERSIIKLKANRIDIYNVLVYCEELTRSTTQAILTKFSFQIFLLDEKGEISLNAMAMYTEKQCEVPQLIKINRFLDRKWTTKKFFAMRIENFYGCEMNFLIQVNQFPFQYYENSEDGKTMNFNGILIEMMKALSTHLNFTFSFELWKDGDRNTYFRLETYTRRSVTEKFASDLIYTDSEVMILAPGVPYTPWEKLMLPFDELTWMWIGIFFAVAFVVILLIRISRSSSIYEFVVGSNVTTPSLNIVAILMGIGQLHLPHRNIARFLFVNFVIFCLIIRTAYQGKYFEFITGDVRKKPIATLEEMVERNVTVYHDSRNMGFHYSYGKPKGLEE